MATTGTGQSSQGPGATEWGATTEGSRDRRPAADTGGIAQTVRETTYRRLDDQKGRAVDTLGSIAGAVREMAQPLRDGGQEGIANYVSKAADSIERWSGDLRQRDLEDAMRAVQEFARRQPALFLGMAFTAGILAARFMKSSPPASRYDDTASVGFASGRGDGRYSTGRTESGGYAGNSGAGEGSRTGIGVSAGSQQFGTTSGEIPRVASDARHEGEVL